MKPPAVLPVVPRCIPEELRSLPQWVVWSLETRVDQPTKIPYDAKTLRPAKSNDPATWSTFEQAWSSYGANRSRWAGLGFMFAEQGGLVGIDLDKCRGATTGAIAEWAQTVIKRLATYAEVSPSATGIKLWARGKLPGDGTGRKRAYQTGAVEMYARGRFFAVTGHRLEPGADGIHDAQTAIDWLWGVALADRLPRPAASLPAEIRRRWWSGHDEARIRDRARKYLASMAPAISGQGGDAQTFAAACKLVIDFGLSPRSALPLLREYNERCIPPWDEKDLCRKLNSADKQPGERGRLVCEDTDTEPADQTAWQDFLQRQPQTRKVRQMESLRDDATVDNFEAQWEATPAADELPPLPSGEYEAELVGGELTTNWRTQSKSYRLCFRLLAAEQAGRRLYRHCYLSPAALAISKGELKKVGITEPSQLASSPSPGGRFRLRVLAEVGEDGTRNYRVRGFDVIEAPAAAVPF